MEEVWSQVLQEDAVRGGGLEVEGDVGAGLPSVQGEVEVGGGATEGRCVPVVALKDEPERDVRKSTGLLERGKGVSLTVSLAPQGSHSQLGLRAGSARVTNHHLTDWQVVFVDQQP